MLVYGHPRNEHERAANYGPSTSLEEFAHRIAEAFDAQAGEVDFDKRQSIIGLLDIQAILALENYERVAYVRARSGRRHCV
jgi:hypothetical protein